MTHDSTSRRLRTIPICPSASRPALRLTRCISLLRVKTTRRAFPTIRAQHLPFTGSSEHNASAFDLRMAVSEQAYMRAATADMLRDATTATSVTLATRHDATGATRSLFVLGRRAHTHAQLLLAEGVKRRDRPRRAAKAGPALQVFRRLIPRAALTLFEPARDPPWRTAHTTIHGFLAAGSAVRIAPRRSPARPSSASW
jgi:hypothetical protein